MFERTLEEKPRNSPVYNYCCPVSHLPSSSLPTYLFLYLEYWSRMYTGKWHALTLAHDSQKIGGRPVSLLFTYLHYLIFERDSLRLGAGWREPTCVSLGSCSSFCVVERRLLSTIVSVCSSPRSFHYAILTSFRHSNNFDLFVFELVYTHASGVRCEKSVAVGKSCVTAQSV